MRKNGRHSLVGTAFLALLLLAMAAAPALAKTTVTIWYPWGGPDGEQVVTWAKEYSATHNVTIDPILVSGSGLGGSTAGKFVTAVTGGNPPDAVLYWGQDMTASMAGIGAIQPLDNFIKKYKFNVNSLLPSSVAAMKYQGHYYALPEMANVRVLIWNKDLFAKAGLNPERPPQTLAELAEYSQKLTKTDAKGDITQMGFVPFIQQGVPWVWIHMFGGSVWDDKTQRPTLNTKAAVEALEWQVEFINKYGNDKVNSFLSSVNTTASGANDPFVAGKVAMMIAGEWQPNYIKKYAPDMKFGVAPIPQAPGGPKNPTLVDGNMWFIPTGAKHADEAFQFILWTLDAKRSAAAADNVSNISPVKAALSLQKLNRDPYFRVALDVANHGAGFAMPVTPALWQMTTELNNAFQAAYYGKATPENALDQAQKNILQYMKDNNLLK